MATAIGLPPGFSLTHPELANAEEVLALMNACDTAAFGEADSDLEDFIFDWKEADLARDGWLIRDIDGALAAYALVSTWSGGFDVQCFARPDLASAGLQGSLLAMVDRRARELQTTMPDVPPRMRSFAAHTDRAECAALAAAGYHPETYHFRMQIDQTEPPPEPVWPSGCQLRNIRPGQDDELVYQFIQRAFDRPGRTPQPFAEWRDFMMREDHFVPGLWFLLFCDYRLAGVATCYDYDPYGWVRHLAVAEEHRRQGIGSALLYHVFGVFYRRGKPRVALGVEGTNENAYRLYERVGMRRVRQFDEYRKRLD